MTRRTEENPAGLAEMVIFHDDGWVRYLVLCTFRPHRAEHAPVWGPRDRQHLTGDAECVKSNSHRLFPAVEQSRHAPIAGGCRLAACRVSGSWIHSVCTECPDKVFNWSEFLTLVRISGGFWRFALRGRRW